MKILAYTSPARGHLYPIVPIMLALAARGHETKVCTLTAELGHLAEVGIAGLPVAPAVERIRLEDWRKRSIASASLSVLGTFAERSSTEVPDLASRIEELDPDILLVDIICWGAAAVAEASGRPWAMYSPFLLPLLSRTVPPLGLGWAPLGGVLGAARDGIAHVFASLTMDRVMMPPINRVRASQGLPALAHYGDVLLRPSLLLVLTDECFEYARGGWPANVKLIGPIGWAPRPHESPTWLAEIGDPVVLVACSSERQDDDALVAAAFEALPPAGMSVIATTAAHDPRDFSVPPGSRAVRFLSHETVLKRAACVVCHGGMGVTQKALAAGVPVVVVPFGRDQYDTGRRVEVANAGVRLSRHRFTPTRLLAAVHSALELREGAQRMSRAYAAGGGPVAAAEAIEQVTTSLS